MLILSSPVHSLTRNYVEQLKVHKDPVFIKKDDTHFCNDDSVSQWD